MLKVVIGCYINMHNNRYFVEKNCYRPSFPMNRYLDTRGCHFYERIIYDVFAHSYTKVEVHQP